MHCLVLGGAGFIGSHIVDALVARDHRVRVFDLPNVSTQNLKQCIDSVEIMGGDFNNVNDISVALESVDVVVHLACTTLPGPSNENPTYDVQSNVVGTINLVEKSIQKGVRKIVFASSGGTVYGIPQSLPIPETHRTNPRCSYGITKLTIEKYLSLFHYLYKNVMNGLIVRRSPCSAILDRPRLEQVVLDFFTEIHQPFTEFIL